MSTLEISGDLWILLLWKNCFQDTGSSEPVARKGYFWRQLSQLPAMAQTIPKARETCPAMSSLCKSGKRTSARRQIPQAMQNFAKPVLKSFPGKADWVIELPSGELT